MATNHDYDHAIDCDDFEISSDLHIECAKGDLHNALGTHREAVEDSVLASSPTSNNEREVVTSREKSKNCYEMHRHKILKMLQMQKGL